MDEEKIIPNPLEIWCPVSIAGLSFSLKESLHLSKLHFFLLLAIANEHATVDEIVDVTQLSKNVITQELHEMYKQKLLNIQMDDKENYCLTELSKKLLHYDELISKMNSTPVTFAFDLVTGILDESSTLDLYEKANGITANKMVSALEMDCIDPVDIRDTLCTTYPNLGDENESELLDFLDNLVIESKREKKIKWKKRYISYLPNKPLSQDTDKITFVTYVIQYRCRAFESYFEDNISILQSLERIKNFDSDMLNKKAVDILEKWFNYQETKKETVDFYYDPVLDEYTDGRKPSGTIPKKVAFTIEKTMFSVPDEVAIDKRIEKIKINDFNVTLKNKEIVQYEISIPTSWLRESIEEEEII